MGISIHIEDVSREQPEALWRTGAFLMDMAVEGGYVMDDEEHPVPMTEPPVATDAELIAHINAGVEAASAPVAPIFTIPAPPPDNTEVIDVESGEIVSVPPAPDLTAVFGAGAHRPAIDLAVPSTGQTVAAEMVSVAQVPPAIEPPPAVTSELDSRGLPWDARIHGRTKAKIGDGTWRYRRGSTDDEIAVVEAELRQTMGAPAAPAATEDFGAFMQFVISSVASGKIQQPQVVAVVNEFGLPHVGAVFQRQDLIPQIREKIEALLEGGA